MKKRLKVYLGGSKGNWRSKIKKLLPFDCYNPFSDSKQNAIATFTSEDLIAIDKCDLVIFYIDYFDHRGSCVEAGYAFAKEKPIILIWLYPKTNIASLFVGVSKRIFTNFRTAIEWLKKEYIIEN